jgi:hypothetical protein
MTRQRNTPRTWLRLWRLARQLDRLASEGKTLIDIPSWLQAEVRSLTYERQVARAAERWEQAVTEVSLDQWQSALGERRPK